MEILCKLCKKKKASSLGTERCDRCWELETRVLRDPELALKTLGIAGMLPANSCQSPEFADVESFHEKFGLRGIGCGSLSREQSRQRADQMREELREFEDACADNQPVKAMDALVDLVYFALGSAVTMGVQEKAWMKCWDAVHLANMRKVRSGNLRDLKQGIVKPEGWVQPDLAIAEALQEQGLEL